MWKSLFVAFLIAGLAALPGCGGCAPDEHLGDDAVDVPEGPYDEVPLDDEGVFQFDGLDGAVHVARDNYGVAHIHATTLADLAFVQGYVMAHDRLPQMDILRRFGSGRLSELFGGLEPGVIETDLEMRVHQMERIATDAYATLSASSDPTDREIITVLDRFADGVNAYAADLAGGRWELDSAVRASFDPARFVAWDPVDSLVLGRFQAFALSWTTPFELDITEVYQGLRETFDQAQPTDAEEYQRVGISGDILRLAPVGRRATIDGFPNVTTDTGTRSDGSTPAAAAATPAGAPAPDATRPHVPRHLLHNARKFFQATMLNGPHSLMAPRAGSNNWIVADEVAGGKTLIAGDQHLDLPNPAIFYPVHLTVPGKIDAQGITFPGIPGIVLGHNGEVAWSATVVFHDANDVYLETIQPCGSGGGDCAQRTTGPEVRLETFTETIEIGVLGTITGSRTATYEVVPGRGPIIPTVVDGEVVPRTGGEALSVQYTGYDESYEIRATYGLITAGSVDDGFDALAHFSYGAQNWVLIDNQGNIGWTSNAKVPLRSAAAYTWNAESNPDGLAPFFVLPGDGSVEWAGMMSPRYIPHAINPPENYLATANSDPVGQSFDNDPFNSPLVDGRPLWVGATYAAGVRTERIRDLLDDAIAAGPVDLDDLAAIQHDSASTMGMKLRGVFTGLPAILDDPTGQPADVIAFVGGLTAAQEQAVRDAIAALLAWSFETPPAVAGSPSAQEVTDSTATTVFNTWMHFFIENVLKDELDRIQFDLWQLNDNLLARTIYGLLIEPSTLVQSADTSQPVICDDMTTPATSGSCTGKILESLLDAVTHLASPAGFGSDDQASWRWGELHTLTMNPLFPNSDLQVPADGEPGAENGFPRAGDNFVVNRADCGWADLGFAQHADGPAQRFLAEAEMNGTVRLRWALPGGTIYDRDSPHYRDLLDEYYLQNRHFDAPYATPEIIAEGESRWVFYTP
jgi:penicillin amidase